MPNKSPIAILQEIALGNVFDEEMPYDYYQRKMCRTYSKMFFTSLPEVEKMPFHDVLTHIYENRFEEIKEAEDGETDIKEMVARTLDPEYDKHKEEELLDFMKKVQQKATAQVAAKEFKKTFNEPPPPEVKKPISMNPDGLDDLVTGIGTEEEE